ncbi:MAG TPA: MFS transporter [Verrucomicrobiae bacterium]|nr:MFS transporter [Verrucomicrobiae bacterium]
MNSPRPARPASSNYRWIICALLFFSTTVNYMDRNVISYLKEYFCTPAEAGGFGWSNTDFSHLTAFFTGFYAGMTILAGWVIDRIGTKMGLALSLIVWSIFGMLNAFVGRLVAMHVLVRSAFGIGEAGNFPASIKTVAEWFPKRERALATGIFNSGSNVGAMISALFVPWCLTYFGNEKGWKLAFIITGAVGFIWLIFWFWLYDTPAKSKRLSKAEYDHIHSDKDEVQAAEIPAKKTGVNLFSFAGRVPRSAFWGMTIMIHILCAFIYFITEKIVGKGVLQNEPALIFFAVTAAVAIAASLALNVRRWHDLDKSGWLAATYFIPVAAAFASVIVFGFENKIYLVAVALAVVAMIVAGFKKGIAGPDKFGNTGSPGLLGHRQTWSFFVGKFMTDGVWWFYLFWLPDYLVKQFHMPIHDTMWPTFIVFGVSIIGSVYGGSIPMTLMKRGMPVYQARMTAMFIIALCPLAVLSTQYFGNVGRFGDMAKIYAVAVICIGAAAHQAWSANMFTTVSDMFPKSSVGSVTGIGAMAGGLGGVIVQLIAGTLTDTYKATPQTAYLIMFIICALSYLIAWTGMKLLVPRHKPITDL